MADRSAGVATHDASTAPLAEEVRRATQRYQDVTAATASGYALFLGCVSSPQGGAMGIHYLNGDLVGDAKLDQRWRGLVGRVPGGRDDDVLHLYSTPTSSSLPPFGS